MQKLNLPGYAFKYRFKDEKRFVFDEFRRKFLLYTPEEEVRQRFARYLIEEKGYPPTLILTEYSLRLNEMSRRCDILVHKPAGNPAVLVECKAPGIKIFLSTPRQKK